MNYGVSPMLLKHRWVCCFEGQGYLHEERGISSRKRHFKKTSVGKVKKISNEIATVWLIGLNEVWNIPISEIAYLDVLETGDKFQEKICNICHRLLSVNEFARNQNNKHGIVRRPSCNHCRTDIDKRAPKSGQAKTMEKMRPSKGDPFQCPICRKRSIVGITAKIVADHNHHTGDIRDFICDSCNTGLGRFKNGEDHLRDAIKYLEERETWRN